ncbi:MAG: enoyl-CoA hydratase [Syntrophales bacterium]|nr:enoyl-CoA hydratase [Syntrophales bacterium]
MNYRYVRFEPKGSIGYIILNNPKRRNALSQEMLKELIALQETLIKDEAIKVVIIKGEGSVFSSGHDINELIDKPKAFYDDLFQTCGFFMKRLQKMPQPVIAQVHGVATAAGCQLVAACDLAVAEEGATFQTPGVLLGFFCTTPAIPLVRAIGRKRALEMLFTGRMISAREALDFGLVNRVVPLDRLEEETLKLAEEIAAGSRYTLGLGKRAFYTQVNMSDAQAYTFGSEVMVSNLFTEDAKEGLKAFLEKRKPIWQGR